MNVAPRDYSRCALTLRVALRATIFAGAKLSNSACLCREFKLNPLDGWQRQAIFKSQIDGAPNVMNLGTGSPQSPYFLEQTMLPIDHARGRCVCLCYICFLRRGGHSAMSEANSKDNG
jgi:hypothetical protein